MNQNEANNWSDTIRKKRLSWHGHVSRLDEQTPAQTAIKIIRTNNNMQKLGDEQKTTWIKNLGEKKPQ